ncbi:MAG: phosphopantothenate--cysteine ligase, partial [Firmicutes bacterium]|nr:phosphopantothenate--cysteine ligase [Bacillota bacterium]
VELHPIRSTNELLEKMTELTGDNDIDIIIHSMAVSDYTTASFVSLEELLRLLAESDCETVEDVRDMLEREDFRKKYTKLPSSIDDPVIMLKQTPKVLSHLRDLAPEAVIVGFKLLDHVSHEELMDVAAAQIAKNRTDFCMANDYATVVSPVHVGFLLDKEGKELRFDGKDAIAKGVVDNTLELKRG